MIDSGWLRRSAWTLGLLIVVAVCGYGWFRVDWYDYSRAEPPEVLREVVADTHTEFLDVLINADDAIVDRPHVGAGDSFQVSGRIKLDPTYWAVPLTQGQSISLPKEQLEQIRIENQKKVRPVIHVNIVCRSWLNPGEKTIHSLLGTMDRIDADEIAWKTSGTLLRPGVYLVLLLISEQASAPPRPYDPVPKTANSRVLQRFLLEVDPYNPKVKGE
ncbi:MAG: hypothetical protein KDB01_08050 [Planctomycetaceae bacterium]|nr:hypothetical protein [Planctomycetaceae bacterium]